MVKPPDVDERSSEAPGDRWPIPAAAGPNWLGCSRVRFRVWAPHANQVHVELARGTSLPLAAERGNPHFWSGDADNVAPGDRYQVVLEPNWNDCYDREGLTLRRRDPYAREAEFESNWCVLPHPSFPWLPFQPAPFNELVIYELHVGTFGPPDSTASAFELASRGLDHIRDLGFNAIQLMPVTEFGGLWGYNPRQLLSVHSPWGTAEQLRCLVDHAHRLGLAVIVDVVLNHGSAKRNCLWNWDGYGPNNSGGIFFEGEQDTPWGRRFAFHKPEVRDYIKAACRMWIEEYNVDGLRFDSVHNMPWSILREITHDIRRYYPGKLLVAEITPENPAVVSDAGFDACWIHSAHFDAVKFMRRKDWDGHRRLATLESILDLHPGFPRSCSAVNSLLGSHDQIGDRRGGHEDGGIHRHFVARWGGRDHWHARAQARAWYAIQATARGLPLVFMGTETLQDGWWHVDRPFDWNLAQGDPLAHQMMACVRSINTLRRRLCALTSENIRFVHEDASNTVLAWLRWADQEDPRRRQHHQEVVLCVANLGERQWSNHDYSLYTGFTGHTWRLVFNSQSEDFGGWQGSGPGPESLSDNQGRVSINLPKWSVLVFELE